MIEDCASSGRLTDWETRFIESVSDQFERMASLSEKQLTILERVYTERVP